MQVNALPIGIPRPFPKPIPATDGDKPYALSRQLNSGVYADEGSSGDRFGYSVAVSSQGSLVVGAPFEDDGGVTHVITYGAQLSLDNDLFVMPVEQFGGAVSMSPDDSTVVVTGKFFKPDGIKLDYVSAFIYTIPEDDLTWDVSQVVSIPATFDTPLAVAATADAFIVGVAWGNSPAKGGSAYLFEAANGTFRYCFSFSQSSMFLTLTLCV